MMKNKKDFDPQMISELRALDEGAAAGLVNSLVDLFSNDTPKLLAEIEGSLKKGDYHRVGEVAHKLKSSSGNLGAIALSNLASDMENCVLKKEANLALKLQSLFSQISELTPKVIDRIKQERS